jgi:hypothetical protein
MDHLTNEQKKQFITDEFSTIAGDHQILGCSTEGAYNCNHKNWRINFLLAILLEKLGFDQNNTQVSGLLNDADMLCK